MALTYTPKVGEVLECDFGDFVKPPLKPVYNGLMTPEIRKRRMVVVLNGRLPNGCTMVVPISSSGNPNAVQRGMHVFLDPAFFTITSFYDKRDRWALAECITHVSKDRLSQIKDRGAPIPTFLPRDKVTAIQKAVIKAIAASVLLAPDPTIVPAPMAGDDKA
ncbi:type II toxin-antitoxin system PemK/MazF family toxin [Pseudomonas syringae group genomosp. 3]|uniref:type II toxin-antitoxin system PemK/MazF family toxin n=1 Tax=Pseudomonas syringae group genomosp. 3 TaxID=251701 RepID=UPI0006B929BE|nr:type II toxin-antitoxin system PemK/MazF family toxin [Pseudomonas syringae group genomosp. 3]